jgi:hypothetical protein
MKIILTGKNKFALEAKSISDNIFKIRNFRVGEGNVYT